DQAVNPLATLRGTVEDQVLRLALEIRDIHDPELLGRRGQGADGIRVGERGGWERRQALLLEVCFRLRVGILGVRGDLPRGGVEAGRQRDRKSTRLNSSHQIISYA